MFDKKNFSQWMIRIGIPFVLAVIIWTNLGHSQTVIAPTETATLEGTISIHPTRPLEEPSQVQPGSAVKLRIKVENLGKAASAPGQVYIRYAFSKPLHNEPSSVLFETEKALLPSIEPGKSVEITFQTLHQLPSILDYIRNDWAMREYQGIIKIDDSEKMISSLILTISAYYYPGIHKEYPQDVPAES